MEIPHTTPPHWPTIPGGRFAEQIRKAAANGVEANGCKIALVGLPDDLGVSLNSGRIGAAHGPAAFRAALARYGTAWDAGTNHELRVGVVDVGDVIPASGQGHREATLNETHDRVTEALLAVHAAGMVPVCIGGGHDLTFPTVRALSRHVGGAVGGRNIDAHLDVRETVGSGMPFRRLIEGGFVDAKQFAVLGAGRFANAPEHVKWLIGQGGHLTITPQGRTREGDDRPEYGPSRARFLSFDMDAIDGSQAPGVSAVNPCGISVREGLMIVDALARDPAVRHFDIMELNPLQDDPAWDAKFPERVGRTARIAALLFLTFVAAFAERGS